MPLKTLFHREHDQPIVTIASGGVQGDAIDNYHRFLGIPYAQPPIGDLRFQLPAPVHPWKDLFDATSYGTPCPNVPRDDLPELFSTAKPENIRSDDNWLTVNVWAPKNVHNAPVFVWFHGGAFTVGSNAETIYDGDTFARDGIVYVNVNYRLGIEGFGVFPDAPNNRGIADQILALRWVQENIAAFGGDPNNVTIGGQSAGAMSVGMLVTSPQTQGLFSRAILQSGAPTPMRKETVTEYVVEVAVELETNPTAEHFSKYTPEQIIDAMSRVDKKPANKYRILSCGPVIDGEILPRNPMDVLTEDAPVIPLLIGFTADEGALWTRVIKSTPLDITWENYARYTSTLHVKPEIIEAYKNYYQPKHSAEEAFMHLMSDMAFVSPIRSIIKAHHKHSVYGYIFSWHNKHNDHLSFHALDVPFVFDHLDTPDGHKLAGRTAPKKLADTMHKAWVDFITTGNPGWKHAGIPIQYYEFTHPETNELVIDPRTALLDVWED